MNGLLKQCVFEERIALEYKRQWDNEMECEQNDERY